jgi:hypothetical protein
MPHRDLYVSFVPLGAWILVVLIRLVVEGPIENAVTTSPVIGGGNLVDSLRPLNPEPPASLTPIEIAHRGSSFAVYGTLASLYMGFSVAVAIGGLLVARRTLAECFIPGWQQALPIFGCIVTLFLFVFGARSWHEADFVFTWKDFGEFLRGLDPSEGMSLWISLTKVATTFGFVASFSLLILSCVILLPEQGNRIRSLEKHRRRIERLDLVLILGTALFVFALIRDRAFFAWVDSFVLSGKGPSTEAKSAILHIADGCVTVNGIYLSILTAAIYLPCACILNARTNRLVPDHVLASSFSERKEWLGKHGLDRDLKDHLLRAATVIAPAITGGASGLIEAFGK